MFASVAAMAASMPAVAEPGHGKAHQQHERAKPRAKAHARVDTHVRAKVEARRDHKQARPKASARVRAQTRAHAKARAEARRTEHRREDARQDRRRAQARRAEARQRAEVRDVRQERRADAQRVQERRHAERRRQSARESVEVRDRRQTRVAARERIEDRRERRQREIARQRLDNQRDRQRRVAARERIEDRHQRRRLVVLRERLQDQRRLQRRLAARDRWQDRQRYFAQQARRYRLANYRWDDRDYRYLYRHVAPTYFRSASNFYTIGRPLPVAYRPRYNVPFRYRRVYYDTPDHYYRYDDGYIYRVSAGSNLIADVIPLLGGGFAVGQLMPVGYDVYNVPYQYRDYYYDTPDAYYRYGDGGIYQVDPMTGMIQAIVALLAGDLNIGQPLPLGYSAYNLPLAYRDQYYDNGDYLYRYNDGNIYRASARTRVVDRVIPVLI
jgi:hypothetical protein